MAWFLDGTRLVASGVGPAEHGEKSGIWIINVLTATPRQIRGNAEGAVPSPDGTLVAFHNSTGEPQISVVDTSGENVRVLVTATLDENFGKLQWSPDGKKLAFIVFRVGSPEGSIETIDLASGKRSEITRKEHLRTFVWLKDGCIVYTSARPQDPTGRALHVLDGKRIDRRVEIGAGLSVAQMSATLDGRKLAIIRASKQADVYAAVIGRDGSVAEPRRLTLDDRDDRPNAWMADGQAVLFESNRNGTWDIFRQRLESPAAEPLATGTGDQLGAQNAPGGAAVLYWSTADPGSDMRLMSVPAAGGPSNVVLQAGRAAQFRCASRAASQDSACVLAEFDGGKMTITGFNGSNGTKSARHQLPVQVAPGEHVVWALSPDGRSVAVAMGGEVRVINLASAQSWSVPASSFLGTISGLAFRDAAELVVTTASSRDSTVVLVTPRGARKIWSSPRQVFSPIVSTDGKHLLLGIITESSNAWLVEDF